MLRIRLARAWRRKLPFFRIVLTEHTKSAQWGYTEIFGWFDPIKHVVEINVESIKEWIAKWAKPSERVAKIAYKSSGDDFFKQFFIERSRTRTTRNPDKFENN